MYFEIPCPINISTPCSGINIPTIPWTTITIPYICSRLVKVPIKYNPQGRAILVDWMTPKYNGPQQPPWDPRLPLPCMP